MLFVVVSKKSLHCILYCTLPLEWCVDFVYFIHWTSRNTEFYVTCFYWVCCQYCWICIIVV